MKQLPSRISLALSVVVLLAIAWALATIRQPDDCSPAAMVRLRVAVRTAAGAPAPTLAPPQKVVLVHVEADRSDIEVGWAEN